MRWLAASIIVAFSACSKPPPPSDIAFEQREKVLTGYMMHNWEAGFTVWALGLEGSVCLDMTSIGDDLREPEPDAAMVELQGHLSERGRYGHMGGCAYVFQVTEIVEQRTLTPSEREGFLRLGRNVFETPPGENPGAGFDCSFQVEER